MSELRSVKDYVYIIIPMSCIIFWALINLINLNFIPIKSDFYVLYLSGKNLLVNPKDLYKDAYFHLPVFGALCAVTFSLLPYYIAYYIMYLINIFFGLIFIYKYNKILILFEVENKIHRFIFLLIISNGFVILGQFYQNQYKIIIGVIFFFIIEREIEYRKELKEKNLKFYIINYGLFAFAVGIFIPFIFLFLIYILNEIHYTDLFKKENVKKYLIVLVMFSVQNFLVFVYPNYFLDFLALYERHNDSRDYFPIFYLREWVILNDYSLIYIISTLYITILTIFLILKKDLNIEKKFSYFAFASIIYSAYAGRTLIILVPFALILYIPFLKQNVYGTEFLKKNIIVIIGLLSIFGIFLSPPNYTIYKYFPNLQNYPYIIFVNLRYVFLLSIYLSSMFILYYKNFKHIKTSIKENPKI